MKGPHLISTIPPFPKAITDDDARNDSIALIDLSQRQKHERKILSPTVFCGSLHDEVACIIVRHGKI